MTVVPIEAGNLVRLTKGDFLVREIPVSSIESVEPFSEVEKGLLGSKDNRKIVLSYTDGMPHSLTIDVDDGKAGEIVRELNTLKDMEARYFEASEFEYQKDGEWVRSRFYFQTPFLAQGEKVLWKEEDMAGFISKRYKWVKAVTNIRALYYDFETHLGTFITLPMIDDILVAGKRVESRSQHAANAYTFRPGYNNYYSYANVQGSSGTTSVTIGDVLIMHTGAPVIRLNSVEDPEGVAALVRTAAKESLASLRAPPPPHASAAAPRQPETGACPACGLRNPAGARFCNQCGSQI